MEEKREEALKQYEELLQIKEEEEQRYKDRQAQLIEDHTLTMEKE